MEKDALFVPDTKHDPNLYLKFGNGKIRYIFHPTFSKSLYGNNFQEVKEWPIKTNLHCLHDGQPFDSIPIPIPLTYDTRTGRIEVGAGVCCSGACVKSWLLEHPQFDTPLRMGITTLMCRDVFDVDETGVAPFRDALDKYGGPLTLSQFRSNKLALRMRAAPFVTRDMLYEEFQPNEDFDRQQQAPAIFGDAGILEQKEGEQQALPPAVVAAPPLSKPKKSRKTTATATPPSRTLASLIRAPRKKDPLEEKKE